MGILSGGLIHPIAIPFGCIIGVLVGFWFNDIRCTVIEGIEEAVSLFKIDFDLGFCVRVQSLGNNVQRWLWYHRFTWVRDLRKATKFGYWCISSLGWLLLSPFRLIKLCLGHPVMVARTIRALSIVCTVVLVIIVSYSIYPDTDEISRYSSILIWSGMATMFSFLVAEGILEEGNSRLSGFYWSWSRYSRQGPVLYAVKSVMQHLLAMCAVVVLFGVGSVLLLGGVASVVLFLVVSAIANALWIASSRHEHLLCVTVTLIVTVTSAIVCNGYMHGVGLWILALTTGLLSGLLTEGVRRAVIFVFNNTVLYKFLGDTIGDPDRPEYLEFGVTKWQVWRWTENFLDSVGQRLASIMTA